MSKGNIMKINERSKFIINALIQKDTYVAASEIAQMLNVSVKTVTRQLPGVERLLSRCGLVLERKTGQGMRLVGSDEARQKMQQLISGSAGRGYSPAERGSIILSQLLKSQEPVKLLTMAQLLDVAETTVSNDLDKLEPKLAAMDIKLVRKPGLGVYLEGLEKDIRKAIINHIYEHIDEKDMLSLLYDKSAGRSRSQISGADRFLLDLVDKNIIRQVEKAVQAALHTSGREMPMDYFSGLVVHLTLAVQRLLEGDKIAVDEQFLTRMRQKPEFATAQKISCEVSRVFQADVPEAETACIAMHLMGARSNYQQELKSEYSDVRLIKLAKQIIKAAEAASGIAVQHKSRLLIGLVKHLGPAAVRMKLKLAIRNPLLRQMKEKYPQWMKIAEQASAPLERELGAKLPEAEVAYLAMHLGSALEESAVNSRRFSVLVACPTGIATSKLLASQLKKVFSNIRIVAIVSAANLDCRRYSRENPDFIISTVPIEDAPLPVVVVDFMLSEEDRNNIAAQIKQAGAARHQGGTALPGQPLTERLRHLERYSHCIQEILGGFFCRSIGLPDSSAELCRTAAQLAESDPQRAAAVQSDLLRREALGSTAVGGLMLLHAKSPAASKISLGLIKLPSDFLLEDKTAVRDVLLMLVPSDADTTAQETIGCIAENLADNLSMVTVLHVGSAQEIKAELEKMYAQYFKDKYKQIMEV